MYGFIQVPLKTRNYIRKKAYNIYKLLSLSPLLSLSLSSAQ